MTRHCSTSAPHPPSTRRFRTHREQSPAAHARPPEPPPPRLHRVDPDDPPPAHPHEPQRPQRPRGHDEELRRPRDRLRAAQQRGPVRRGAGPGPSERPADRLDHVWSEEQGRPGGGEEARREKERGRGPVLRGARPTTQRPCREGRDGRGAEEGRHDLEDGLLDDVRGPRGGVQHGVRADRASQGAGEGSFGEELQVPVVLAEELGSGGDGGEEVEERGEEAGGEGWGEGPEGKAAGQGGTAGLVLRGWLRGTGWGLLLGCRSLLGGSHWRRWLGSGLAGLVDGDSG